MLSFEQITELVELVARHRLRGLALEQEGFRLEIEGLEVAATAVSAPAPAPAAVAASQPASGVAAPVAAGAPAEAAAAAASGHVVTSPIVGTFYSSPSPGADPFVRVGDRVKVGQVLCIVEAMKLMNEIESDVDGTLTEVVTKNGQPVEYGEPLFVVRED